LPNQEAWENHWQNGHTPWDLGGATPGLVEWCRHQAVSGLEILVPGCGQGHDAHFLAKRSAGVIGLDLSKTALKTAASQYQQPNLRWQHGDMLLLPFTPQFDRIWEYTCFCALEPSMRAAYFAKVHSALKPGGVYWGMVFTKVPHPDNGPPFQIEASAFRASLEAHFRVEVFEPGTDRAIRARRGRELWFEAKKVVTKS